MKNFNYQCPIDKQKIIEQTTRINSALVAILPISFIITNHILTPIILAINFFVRGFTCSLVNVFTSITRNIIKLLKIKPTIINAGGKKFAAKIGFIMCLLIIAFHLSNFKIAALVFTIALLSCAALDCLFNFCVGCKIYSLLIKLKKINKGGENGSYYFTGFFLVVFDYQYGHDFVVVFYYYFCT